MNEASREMTLLEDLQYWRSERPDEWTMDRFIRKANELVADLAHYKAEAEFLKTDNHEFIRLLIKRSKEIDRLTAQCKVAEDLLVECKDTILYIKQYVDGHELSAEDDGDNMIKAINDFLGVP